VQRDDAPAILHSGSSAVSSLGDDAYKATIGPFGDVLPGYGSNGTITVTIEATNGEGLSNSVALELTIRDCS